MCNFALVATRNRIVLRPNLPPCHLITTPFALEIHARLEANQVLPWHHAVLAVSAGRNGFLRCETEGRLLI
jgi:hypothetical protein